MSAFLAHRFAQSLVVIILVTIVVFILIHLLPGGPARALLGPRASPAEVHAFIVQNGYNKPIYIQYVRFLGDLVRGRLGYSYHYNQSVGSLLVENLPKTVVLVGLSYMVALLVAVPAGLLQAVRRNRLFDYCGTTISFVGYSMPIFWLGILLILVFSVNLHLLPPEAPQGTSVVAILGDPQGLVLPVATLATVTIAYFSRYMRSSAIESLLQDYIRTARATGVSEWKVISRHVLRNSLIPIITLVGLSLPATLSGAVVTESVFNYPGMGLLFWNAASTHDYPVLLGFAVVIAIATVAGSLLADLLYAVADPRVRQA